MSRTAAFLGVCAVAFFADAAEFDSDVKHLTDADFSDYLNETPEFLVMFYAPWCGHCKAMKPAYADAASDLSDLMPIVAVDCTVQAGTCKDHGVDGYPTLKYFKAQKASDYDGGRSLTAIKNWVNKKVDPDYVEAMEPSAAGQEADEWNPPGVIMATDDTFSEIQQPGKKTLVFFYAPWCGHCKNAKPELEKVPAKLLDGASVAAVDCTQHRATCDKFSVTGYPTIKYIDGEEEAEDYKAGRTTKAMVSFLNKKIDPDWSVSLKYDNFVNVPEWEDDSKEVIFMTEDYWADFKANNDKMLVMFYAPWCGHCKSMKPEYGAASEKLKDDGLSIPLVAVDCTGDGGDICERYNVSGYPTIYWLDGEEKEHANIRNLKAIYKFVHTKLDPNWKPVVDAFVNTPEWEEDSHDVIFMTEDHFDDYLEKTPKFITMFYAPWCGHCKTMKPGYGAASTPLKDHVPLVAVDCTQHSGVCSNFGVDGYPTVIYFEDHKKVTTEVPRDEKALVKWGMRKIDPQWRPAVTGPFINEELWGNESKRVVFMNDEHFHEFRKTHEQMLVMFYAPWCGHCKEAKPHFAAASINFKRFSFVAMDCTKDAQDTCQEFGVTGYPTFYHFKTSTAAPESYRDGRESADFINFVEMQERLAARKVDDSDLSPEKLQKMRVKQLRQLLADRGETCEGCTEKHEFIAKVLAVKDKPKVEKKKRMSWSEEKRYKTATDIATAGWAELDSGNGKVVHLTEWTFEDYLKQHPHTVVMYHTPWCGHCKTAKPEYVKATASTPEGALVAVDCDANSELCKKQKVKGYPTFFYYSEAGAEPETMANGNAKTFTKFINQKVDPDWQAPPPPPYKNEPLWEESSGDVWFATGETWEEMKSQIWAKGLPGMLIMFYAPWCGHCKVLKPKFGEASVAVADKIALVAVDCTDESGGAELCGTYKVDGYPTIKYETPDGEFEDYEGARSAEGIIDFAENIVRLAKETADGEAAAKKEIEDEGKEEL